MSRSGNFMQLADAAIAKRYTAALSLTGGFDHPTRIARHADAAHAGTLARYRQSRGVSVDARARDPPGAARRRRAPACHDRRPGWFRRAGAAHLREPITVDMVIEEINRYADSEFRDADASDEMAIS